MGFSIDFKKAAVQKYLMRGNRPVQDIAEELGIKKAALYQWRDQLAKLTGMKPPSSGHKSPLERLRLISEYELLLEDQRGEFLRKNGLYQDQIDQWKQQLVGAMSTDTKNNDRSERLADKKRIQELEREIRRKDKALAEASALLILKKKADLIWGVKDEEEE